MNIGTILRETWRITWRCWQLWLLNLLLFVVFIPAVALGGAFGGLAAWLTLPMRGRQPDWLVQLRHAPVWAWVLIGAGALILIVLTSAASWMLQAASMRGAALAAERGTFSLGEALNLGWQRVISILKLSLTLGLLIAGLGLFPIAVLLLTRGSDFGLVLMNMAQVGLAPVNMVLGIGLLLIMMAVALEDLRPGAAFRQAWRVFRKGWWGFLLILGLSFLPGFAVALLIIPLAFVIPVLIVSPQVGAVVLLLCCAITGPIGLALILFTAVFTVTLYTLTYRAAAQLAGSAATPPTPA